MPPSWFAAATAGFYRLLSGYGIRLYGATSGFIGLKPSTTVDSTDYTLPAAHPTVDGQSLTSTTVGVMSWQTISGGGGGTITVTGENYLTITGSVLTAHSVDLSSSNVTGVLNSSHLPAPTLISLGGVEATAGIAHRWVYGLDLSGNLLLAQPSYSDIAGTLPAPTLLALGGIEAINAVSHQWINSIDTSGVPHLSQPAFSDISGSIASTQIPNPSTSTLGGIQAIVGVSHQWISSIDTSGVPHLTQPAFSDISGSVASTQLPNPSATTLGGIESIVSVSHQWIDSISTSGVPHQSQPAFTDISGVISSTQGGTGVNNASTITIGGNLSISGAFTTTFTVTANTSVTLPTSGTLLTKTTRSLTFVIDSSTAITANSLSAVLLVPFAATVVGWAIQADQSATVTVDFFKQAYSTSTQPTSNSWLTGATTPSLTASSANKTADFTSSGTNYGAISSGDQILCKILTNNNATRLVVELIVTVNG